MSVSPAEHEFEAYRDAEETFVSEPIEPEPGAFVDVSALAQGLAALPRAFRWRGERLVVAECLEHVKQSGVEVTGERYLRRQAFVVRLADGRVARIYIERQARDARKRWFLYAIASGEVQ